MTTKKLIPRRSKIFPYLKNLVNFWSNTSVPTHKVPIAASHPPTPLVKYQSTPLILIKASHPIINKGMLNTPITPNQLPRRSKKKLSTSNIAVGFAKTAKAKNSPESFNQVDVCGDNFSGSASSIRCSRINKNQLNNATRINVNTHISVL